MIEPKFEFEVPEHGDWAIIHSTLPMDNGAIGAFSRARGVRCIVGGRYGAMVYKGKLFSWDEVKGEVILRAEEMRFCRKPAEVAE